MRVHRGVSIFFDETIAIYGLTACKKFAPVLAELKIWTGDLESRNSLTAAQFLRPEP